MSNEPRKMLSRPWHHQLIWLVMCSLGLASGSVLIGDKRGAFVLTYLPWLADRRIAWAGVVLALLLLFVVARLDNVWRKTVGPDPSQ